MSLILRLDSDDLILSSFWTPTNLAAVPTFANFTGPGSVPKKGFVPAPPSDTTFRILGTTGWVIPGQANGVASLDSGGKIPASQMPNSSIVTVASVANQTARYALTTATVQNGDHVRQTDNSTVWEVIDETNLGNSNGWAQLALTTWSTLDGKPDSVIKLGVKGGTVASASSVNFDTMTGDFCEISGTTTITGCTITAGVVRKVRFTGSLTINHSATILVPGAVNLKVGAGDVVEFTGDTGSVARVTSIMRANGAAPSTAPIYPGEAWVSTSGSDTLGVIGDPNRPFATPGGVPGASAGTVTLHLGVGTFSLFTSTPAAFINVRGAGSGRTSFSVLISPGATGVNICDIGGQSMTLSVSGSAESADLTPPVSDTDGADGLAAATGVVIRNAYVFNAEVIGGAAGPCGYANSIDTVGGTGGAGGVITFYHCKVDSCSVVGGRGGEGADNAPGHFANGGAGGSAGQATFYHSEVLSVSLAGGGEGPANGSGSAGAAGASGTVHANLSKVAAIEDITSPGGTVVLALGDVDASGGNVASATGSGRFNGAWQDS